MPKFAHMHLHSDGSLFDSTLKVSDAVKTASKYEHSAIALTNHGNLFDSIDFYKEARQVGIKPILGMEFYLAENIEEKTRDYTHLTILAQNKKGWENLKRLTTISNKDGFYYRPRIDIKNIENFSDGLICLSGCMSSKLSKLILSNSIHEATYWATHLKSIFKDRFFLELMDGGVPGEDIIRDASRNIGKTLNIPCVATQDAHYLHKDDHDIHEVICALANNSTMLEKTRSEGGRRKRFTTNEFWLKDLSEMSGSLTTEELRMSHEISEICEKDVVEMNINRMPVYDKDSFDKLSKFCLDKAVNKDDKTKQRLNKELGDIKEANLADYFLIVKDIVDWTRTNDIPINSGRGSAAGSLVVHLLGITEVDPIQYGLMWERFYNVGRKGSMPDIDIDVCINRRAEVISYIGKRFGEDRVSHIMSLDTFGIRACIRDVGRAIGLSKDYLEVITKDIPHKGIKTIDQAKEKVAALKTLLDKNPALDRLAKKALGLKKHLTTHPSAIVIGNNSFYEGDIPMAYNASKQLLMTGLDMYSLEDLGYLKLDWLGLKTVTLIGETERLINSR
jgi:DNA polymerase-3 subunit alpha